MKQLSQRKTRRTPQKLAIIEFLEKTTAHPSAEMIHEALSTRFPTMSLSTVYNTLRALQKEGRVHELGVDPSKSRFDPDPRPHHHLICLGCGRISDIHRPFEIDLPADDRDGFAVLRSQVDFFGLCSRCQHKSRQSS
jgi:Fur family peroxide stress response transcriptional regulator